MTRLVKTVCSAAVACLLTLNAALAQNALEEAVKQLASRNVRGYLQPFANSFGANMNSGIYHSAQISNLGFSLRIEFVGAGTILGDAEKTFLAVPPYPFEQTPVPTATVFGNEGAEVTGPGGVKYKFQNGQIRAAYLPLMIPQATLGDFFGTQAILRYVPFPETGDFPRVNILGAGLRHSISRYFDACPVDVAAGAFYQRYTIGDIFDARAFNVGLQASTSFALVTLYGGALYETSSMHVTYAYTGYGSTPGTTITFDMNGENRVRGIAGLGLNLVVLTLNADINVGTVTLISGSIGFGL